MMKDLEKKLITWETNWTSRYIQGFINIKDKKLSKVSQQSKYNGKYCQVILKITEMTKTKKQNIFKSPIYLTETDNI